MDKPEKYLLQDQFYLFPYHYLTTLEKKNEFSLHKYLSWGLEYMTYISFITNLVNEWKFDSLIDVGCGDGRLLNLLTGQFSGRLVGVDVSERAISLAKALNQSVDFICSDIGEVEETFQCVTLIEVLEHIPSIEIAGFMKNISRIINPDGLLVISVPTSNVPLNPKHYRHYDYELLTENLTPYFKVEKHWWLYKICFAEKVIQMILCNRWWIINSKELRSLLWNMHKKTSYFGSMSTGAHLVCLARKSKVQG